MSGYKIITALSQYKGGEFMYIVTVDAAKCTGCEECVTNCPNEVFRMVDGKCDPYQSSECVFCETCLQCPESAITITET